MISPNHSFGGGEADEFPGLNERGIGSAERCDLGTVATLVIVCIYILTNVANVVFYLRHQREEFNVVWNLIVPVVGTLIFIPVLVASFGIDFGGLGIVGLTPPASAAPAVVGVWMVIGVVLYFYLAPRSPAAIRETATTFIEV